MAVHFPPDKKTIQAVLVYQYQSTIVMCQLLMNQGMTIRTARLPGAGNLLGRAGEDLSGLPDRARRYHFLNFIDSVTVSYFSSSTRF